MVPAPLTPSRKAELDTEGAPLATVIGSPPQNARGIAEGGGDGGASDALAAVTFAAAPNDASRPPRGDGSSVDFFAGSSEVESEALPFSLRRS